MTTELELVAGITSETHFIDQAKIVYALRVKDNIGGKKNVALLKENF